MYHYAANNPVSYVDPDGRDIFAVAQNQSFWTGVGIILGTLAEDVATFGAGIADDPATLAIGVGLILAACWVTSNGNNQASPSPLFGSNANVAAASPNPLPPDGDDEEQKKTKSINQMKQDINKRKAPKSVERVDGKNTAIKGEQDHVHFKDGNALNRDGSWKEGAGRVLTNTEKEWLKSGGFAIPE